MSWVGTGRLVFSLNFSDADLESGTERFLAAAEAMRRDGWWEPGSLGTDRAIKRRILREMLGAAIAPWRPGKRMVEEPVTATVPVMDARRIARGPRPGTASRAGSAA